ncbi:DUF411 domain-containing protein [Erythrobacter sp. YJ-T3-07]|uniref:DUF411 domain-containing protein n=1 Tax=Erythrobacter sp. YJ-T3-07 TaxID=2793063 RepID=UPI001F1FC6A1|nr:DUF411 domain-containing protein [Erythrobacter sp. YJ-T3-07]
MSQQNFTKAWNRTRRALAASGMVLLAACTSAVQASPYVMFRDPQCGCCEEWAKHVHAGLEHEVETREDRPMAEVKAELGVPDALASCHTMRVDGYIIEGHVPAREIARLLEERPAEVTGLAVAGMPLGSPGMEVGGRVQPYQVIAFGPEGSSVWASYPESAS